MLLWNFYIVPHWNNPEIWVAYWNKFGIPDKQPTYVGVDLESWWIDPEQEKAARREIQERELMRRFWQSGRRSFLALPAPRPLHHRCPSAFAACPTTRRCMACRPSATSNIRPTSSISTMSTRMRRRAGR